MPTLYDTVRNRLRFGGMICLVVGVTLLVLAGMVYRNHRAFLATAVHTRGEISNYTTRLDNGSTYYKAVIKFTDQTGEGHVFESNTSSTRKVGNLGDRVDVLYSPKVPADAMIDSFSSLWLMPLILAGIGGMQLFVGTLLIIWPLIKRSAERTFETIADVR